MQYLQRRFIPLGVLALSLLLALASAAWFVVQKHRWADARLAELEPRYARLLGLESNRADLNRLEAQANAVLQRFAYPSAQEVSQAGNDAQQRVRSLFMRAGMEVVSSQVLAPKSDKYFDRIPLAVRLEGELVALQSALVVLSGESPAILVDGLTVQTIGSAKGDKAVRLACQLNMSVLRGRP